MKIQAFFLMVVLVAMASGDDTRRVYCGRRLAVMLRHVCDMYTETQYSEKRSQYIPLEVEDYGWQWLEPQRAHQLGGARGKRYGVADECCKKPCTENELLGYCQY